MRIWLAVFLVLAMTACRNADESESKGNSQLPAASLGTPSLPAPSTTPSSTAVSAAPSNSASGVAVDMGKPHLLRIDFKPRFEASDPAAPLEVAVLSALGGPAFILPIMSIPFNPDQFTRGGRDSGVGIEMHEQLTLVPDPIPGPDGSILMTEEMEKEQMQELINRQELLVAKFNSMSSIPRSWVDSSGNRYTLQGAAERSDGVIGGALGFKLKDELSEKRQRELVNRVLLNRQEGFPAERIVPPNEWKHWPELIRELSKWGKKQLETCPDKVECTKAIDWLLIPEHLEGRAYEYSMADGRKLKYVEGKSRGLKAVLEQYPEHLKGKPQPDELQFHLWMYANADGTTQALNGGDGFHSGLHSVGLVDHYCDSQCGASWTGRPSVFSWKEQTYIVGPYSGGTLYGYLVYEVLADKLRLAGRFAWGS